MQGFLYAPCNPHANRFCLMFLKDYDHIVSLYEWESKFDDDEYHDDDLLTFR